jgi:hypothetical protein
MNLFPRAEGRRGMNPPQNPHESRRKNAAVGNRNVGSMIFKRKSWHSLLSNSCLAIDPYMT